MRTISADSFQIKFIGSLQLTTVENISRPLLKQRHIEQHSSGERWKAEKLKAQSRK